MLNPKKEKNDLEKRQCFTFYNYILKFYKTFASSSFPDRDKQLLRFAARQCVTAALKRRAIGKRFVHCKNSVRNSDFVLTLYFFILNTVNIFGAK